MNPVIYFDELDKISDTKGEEIVGILTHLTDTTQNDKFTINISLILILILVKLCLYLL